MTNRIIYKIDYSNNLTGGTNPKYVERTTSLNLRKFIDAISNALFLSPSQGALKSFTNATGGNDLISLSIPDSRASKLYSHKGITFIMKTDNIPIQSSGVSRGEEGEVYAKKTIDLTNSLVGIYISPEFSNQRVDQLELCDLNYGSASIKTKLDYLFSGCDFCKSGIDTLEADHQTATEQIQKEFMQIRDKISKSGTRAEKIKFANKQSQILKQISDKYAKAINLKCTTALLNALKINKQLTLKQLVQEFINKFKSKYNNTIGILDNYSTVKQRLSV